MAFVDDRALRISDFGLRIWHCGLRIRNPQSTTGNTRSNEKMGDLFDRLLGGRQADTQQRLLGRLLQALERQREVRAAPGAYHRVNLVDDDRAHRSQDAAAAL